MGVMLQTHYHCVIGIFSELMDEMTKLLLPMSNRVTAVLGYQPQELLSKSAYEFYHHEDQSHMKESFEQGMFINMSSDYAW